MMREELGTGEGLRSEEKEHGENRIRCRRGRLNFAEIKERSRSCEPVDEGSSEEVHLPKV